MKKLFEKTITRELLHFDALGQAEKISGKSYKEDKYTGILGMLLMMDNREDKNKLLDLNDDTKLSNDLDNYLRIVKDEGFEIIYKEDFLSNHNDKESLFIMWNDKEGILLCFDTYNTKQLNGGHIFYNWKPDLSKKNWYSFISSGKLNKDYIYIGSHDCREAIRLILSDLRENGTFIKPWVEQPFLWILHFMDSKKRDCDYKEINAKRINKFPKHVIKNITI